tara:strand:+ start:3651 stop:7136 length:3486 start_codon:yes stop_codon:yes gene_type:complete
MNFLDSIIEEKKPTSKKPNFLDSIIEEEKPTSKKPNFLDSIIEEKKPKPPTKNFSLLKKLGVEKPKDFNPKEPSFDLEKSFVSGAVGTVDSLGAMFKSLGDDGEIFGNELLANMTSSAGDAIKKVTTPVLDALEVENPSLATDVASGFGSAATFLIPGLGVAKGAQVLKLAPKVGAMLGTGTSAIIESGVESGGVYDRLIEKGMDEKEAGDRANAAFWANIPANMVLDKWMFGKMPGGKFITNMLKGSSKEATQEGIQQIISNVAAEDPAFEGVGRSALVGGIVGGTIGGAKTKLDNIKQEDLTPPQKEQIAIEEEIESEAKEEAKIIEEKDTTLTLNEKKPIKNRAKDILDLADGKPTKLKAFGQKYFTKEKGVPSEIFKANEKRLGRISKDAQELNFKLADFNRVKKEFKQTITPEQTLKLDQALKSTDAMAKLENDSELSQFYEPLKEMRKTIDSLSKKMIDEGLAQGKLEAAIDTNMGVYINRAYKIHSDPNWIKNVRETEAWNKAISWMRSELKDQDMTDTQIEAEVASILEQHSDHLGDFYTNKKTGSKNLGILKKRKVMPQEMLDLLGEITEPDINFANTVGKMSNLLANHQFLTEIKAAGEGKFLFKKKDIVDGVEFVTPIAKSESYSPLNDMYTTKEIAEALQSKPENNNSALGLYLKGMGYAKWAKTVGSPVTQIRNLTSNTAFALGNGHFNFKKMPSAFSSIKTKLLNNTDPKNREYLLRLAELGLIDQSSDIGVAIEMVKKPKSQAEKKLYKGLDKLSQIYQASDTVWKIYAFENEVAQQQKARPEMSKFEIEELSAEIVKNTYPTYSRVSEGVKYIGKSPLVGTFVNFPAEVIRTSYHTLNIAKEEMKNSNTKNIGIKRLGGFAAMVAMSAYAAPLISRMITGTKKEDEDNIRKFIPEWSVNSPLVITGFDRDKKRFSYIDLGTQAPHAFLAKPFIAFMRGDQDLDDRFVGAFTEMLGPFISEEMLTSAIMDISRNKTKQGRPIYSEMDDRLSKITKKIGHIVKVYEPGISSSTRRLLKKQDGKPGYYGNINSLKGEFRAMTTGVRMSTYDIPKSLQFKVDQFKQKKRESYKAGEFKDINSKMNAMKRSYAWMQEHIDAARYLGVKDNEILQLLKKEKVSKKEAQSFIKGSHKKTLQKIKIGMEKYAN